MAQANLTKDYRSAGVSDNIFSSVDKGQFDMTIDPSAMSHIIARLTDLYADPIVATVREIISNAVDATRLIPEADRKPIDIVVPRALSPEFKVTDHGVGLSLDEIKNIYTRYGTSTKGNDFTQIGAYGLGSKAPLSYTTQFSVTAVKDNMLTEILIEAEGNINKVKIVDHREVNQTNMMSVAIPVKTDDVSHFQDALLTYKYHPMDDVKINGLDDLSNFDESKVGSYFATMDYKGIPIKLYFSVNNLRYLSRTILDLAADNDFSYDLTGVLSGFEYKLKFGDSYYSSRVTISAELVPGLVDFSSSRDEITKSPRRQSLVDAIDNYIKDSVNNDLLDNLLIMLNGDDKVRQQMLADALSRYPKIIEDKDLSKKLFTLSNGVTMTEIPTRPLAIITSNRTAPSYGGEASYFTSNKTGTVKRITKHIHNYFNPREEQVSKLKIWRKMHPNVSLLEYDNPSRAQIINDNELSLADYLSVDWSYYSNLIVVTDINSEDAALKTMRRRTTLIDKGSTSVLMLVTESKSSAEKHVSSFFGNLDKKIDYYTADEFIKLALEKRREQRKYSSPTLKSNNMANTKSVTHTVYGVANLTTTDAGDIVSKFITSNYYEGINHKATDKPVTMRLGLILSRSYSSSYGETLDGFIPYALKMGKNAVIKVTVYYAGTIHLNDYESLLAANDYIYAPMISEVRSKQLREKLRNLSLPKVNTIDIDTVDVSDSVKKLLHAYYITKQLNIRSNSANHDNNVPDDYEYADRVKEALYIFGKLNISGAMDISIDNLYRRWGSFDDLKINVIDNNNFIKKVYALVDEYFATPNVYQGKDSRGGNITSITEYLAQKQLLSMNE